MMDFEEKTNEQIDEEITNEVLETFPEFAEVINELENKIGSKVIIVGLGRRGSISHAMIAAAFDQLRDSKEIKELNRIVVGHPMSPVPALMEKLVEQFIAMEYYQPKKLEKKSWHNDQKNIPTFLRKSKKDMYKR